MFQALELKSNTPNDNEERINVETGNEEQDSNNDFIEGRSQLNEIGQPPDNLYDIVRANSRITEEANSIQPNKASHIVAYFTKNENPEQRFLTKERSDEKTNKRNAKRSRSLIEIPNTETADICTVQIFHWK
uniref:Uncharacterized protein n=1 Tax=Rhizophagus irregularis (strain DAOM 181602 / DAOM 197198 / MUCL 43194) TaxID=747089 RepID=U9TZ52_RHIID